MERELFLIDYDGTLVEPEERAWTSMEFASYTIAPDGWQGVLPWSEILEKTKGTTETYLAAMLADIYRIPSNDRQRFQQQFFAARERFLDESETVYGGIYPDALVLLNKLAKKPDVLLLLLTGNPLSVLEQRIHPMIKPFFTGQEGELRGFFGDQAETRSELIRKTIKSAEAQGFQRIINSLFFNTNITYIGDALEETFAAVNNRIKTVFVPKHDGSNYGLEEALVRYLRARARIEPKLSQLYLHGLTGPDPKTRNWTCLIDRTVQVTGSLVNPAVSQFLGVPIEPLYLPGAEVKTLNLESRRRGGLERLS